jgi:ferredoxin
MGDWALPEINLSLCNRCGTCVERCPTHAVEMAVGGPVIVRPDDCTYCAICDAMCPRGAVTCTFEIVWGENDQLVG